MRTSYLSNHFALELVEPSGPSFTCERASRARAARAHPMKNNPRRISSKTMPTRGITRIKAALTKVLQPALISTSARSYVEGNNERIFASLFFAGVFAPISAAFDHFANLPARFVAERHQQKRRYPFQKPIGEFQDMVFFGDSSDHNG